MPLYLPQTPIYFPATQVDDASVNALDDYEEGTWTPSLTFVTAGDLSVVTSTSEGEYVKVGNHVFLTGRVVTSTFTYTTATGGLRLTGLPFTPVTPSAAAMGGIAIAQGFTGTFAAIGWRPVNSSTQADFMATSTTGAAVTTMSVTQWPTASSVNIRIVGQYHT